MDLTTIIAGIIIFLVMILILVSILLYAKSKLVPSGPVIININNEKDFEVRSGDTLLSTLSSQKLYLPSACGGQGTCGECKCIVTDGGGTILATETPQFSYKEIGEGWRLGCMVRVKQDMKIQIPEAVFGVKKWEAKVVSNYNVAYFIKEFVIEVPKDMNYKPGGYIQIEVPRCTVEYKNIDITAHPEEHPGEPDKFKSEWDKFDLWPLVMRNNEKAERAYSMASYPAEGRRIMLNVRVETPPFDQKRGTWMKVNPGVASSYIFALEPGDTCIVSGPYGEFFINESDAEMLYVGGGAGMAPLRSHLYHLFKTVKTGRKVTFWYGGRSRREMFYIDHFKSLEEEFPNFRFFMALSESLEEDNLKVKKDIDDKEGDGFVGFIHQAVIDNYLVHHDEPEEIKIYFCGPPMMNMAVEKMGKGFVILVENIRLHDFTQ